MFTYQYSQPSGYHFSLDSIYFAEFLAHHLQGEDVSTWEALDLCAGCGVIGLELSWYLRQLHSLDFVEVQDVYSDCFLKNIALVNRPELKVGWHVLNYDALLEETWAQRYNLIISNPPYFQPHQGMLSPSEFKNRCRFYLDSTFENFILAIANSLAIKGKAFFLLRPLIQHGFDAFAVAQQLLDPKNFTIQTISQLRGTDIVLIEKLN